MTGLLLGAIDQTVVATASPIIIADLQGLRVYAWTFSAYILTRTVAMPVFGKLSDLYGRKKFFRLGLVIFIVGSILFGAAQDINQLIIFRAIQGIGSGAFFPVAIAVVGVVFPPALRGRVQGIFSTVFGIADVVGPLAGAAIVDSIGSNLIGRILADPKTLAAIVAANPAFAPLIPTLRTAFIQSLTPVYQLSFLVAIGAVVASLFIRGTFKQQVAARTTTPEMSKEPVAPEISAATSALREETSPIQPVED